MEVQRKVVQMRVVLFVWMLRLRSRSLLAWRRRGSRGCTPQRIRGAGGGIVRSFRGRCRMVVRWMGELELVGLGSRREVVMVVMF